MDAKRLYQTFCEFNHKYFWSKLGKVKVAWSKKMTLCAGKTYLKVRGKKSSCSIRLSWPLLSQRPQQDTINTLLHEMIHAYFNVTRGINFREAHGPNFRKHMARINSTVPGAKVTISHNFRQEVNNCRVHVYRCDGPCRFQRPNFGVLRRAVSRPPGPTERWWEGHKRSCGGTFKKVQGSAVKQLDAQKQASINQSNSSLKHTKSVNNRISKPMHKPSKPIVPKSKKAIIPKNNSRTFEKKHPVKVKPNVNSVTKFETPIIEIDLSKENDVYEFSDSHLDQIKPIPSKNKPLIIQKRNSHPFEKKNKVKSDALIDKSVSQNDIPNEKKNKVKFDALIDKSKSQNDNANESNVQEVLDDPLKRIREKYSSPKKSILVEVNEVSRNAYGIQLVKGNIDLTYICKNPKIINIEKYMEKLIGSTENEKNEFKSTISMNMHTVENNFVSGNMNYNYKTKSNININKYLNKYKKSFDLNEINNLNQNKSLNNESILNKSRCYDDKSNKRNNSATNLESKNNNCKKEKDSPNQNTKNSKKCLDFGQIMICPNCDKDILQDDFREHLSYCLDPEDENDEDDSDNNDDSEDDKSRHNNDNGNLCFALPDGFMNCPACMEPVKEKEILKHMDDCLEWMAEEF